MLSNDSVLIPARDLPRLLRKQLGRSFHRKTIARWMRSGVGGPDGRRIVLASVKVGRARFVEPDALDAFCAALTKAWARDLGARPTNRSTRNGRAAARYLDAQGLGESEARRPIE